MKVIRAIWHPDASSELTTRRDSIGSSSVPSASSSNQMASSAGQMTSMMMAAPPPLIFNSSPRHFFSEPFSSQVHFARDPMGELESDRWFPGRVGDDGKRSGFQRFPQCGSPFQREPDGQAHRRCPLRDNGRPASTDIQYFDLAGDVFGALIPAHDASRISEPMARRLAPFVWRPVMSIGRSPDGPFPRITHV
jgi:hypothetical protein